MSRFIAPLLLGIFLVPLLALADSPTVSIQSLSPGSGVVTGTNVTFTATSTGLTNPTYSVTDSFQNSSVGSSNVGLSSGSFNWMPVFTDIGNHTVTVTATDASGNSSASASQNINVSLIANVSISGVTPGTSIDPGQNLKFNVVPVGFASTTSYSVSDSFGGSTVSSSNINSSGNFSWTPAAKDAGSHKITVNVSDSEGRSASGSLTITVGGGTSNSTSVTSVPATLILTAPVPDASIPVGATVTFSALAYGFSNPTFSVSDAFSGTSISKSNINSSGNFSWTPTSRDMGTHNLTVTVSDTLSHSATATAQITVTAALAGSSSNVVSNIPVSPPVPSSGAAPGAGATFTTYLRLGMSSEEVRALQNALAREGFFSGSATGYFGPMTESAVKNFQKANGLDPLGVVGVQTRAVLNALSGNVPSPTYVTAGTNTGRIATIEAKISAIQTQLLLIQQQLTSVLEELARLKAGQ